MLSFFLKNMKIGVTGPFSQEYYITEETGEKCVLHIFFGLCCFPFICQRTGTDRHHSIYYFITLLTRLYVERKRKIVIGQYGRIEKNGRKMKWRFCLSRVACCHCIGYDVWWEKRKKI